MKADILKKMFEKSFDLVGIIETNTYLNEASIRNINVPDEAYPTMVVVGLAYPYRVIKHTKTHLIPSFYTFGQDYHTVLKKRMDTCLKDFPYPYHYGVDNHPHNERLAAVLAGLGFFGKNQLIINDKLGSYFFLGIVFINESIDRTITLDVSDDCGTCRKCIDACPPGALYEGGFNVNKCMSHYNQSKRILLDEEVDLNYSLFGCDICQMVCPKNIKKGTKIHSEFELSGKEHVSIQDLFTLSEKGFKETYKDMSYLWKGKTILMRNALMVLKRMNNHTYDDFIKSSLTRISTPWYVDLAKRYLEGIVHEKDV